MTQIEEAGEPLGGQTLVPDRQAHVLSSPPPPLCGGESSGMAFHHLEPQFPRLQDGRKHLHMRGPGGRAMKPHAPGTEPRVR